MRAFLFDTKVANEVGVEAAVVLQNMNYVANWPYMQDFRIWANLEDLNELFPFFTKRKILRLLEILINKGYIEQETAQGLENKATIYRITEKGYSIIGE